MANNNGMNSVDAGSGSLINVKSVDFSDVQEKNAQTLTDIQNLQVIEKDLFTTLEEGLASNTLTPEQKDSIINKINEIAQMRANLYKNISGVFSFFQNNVSSARDTLMEQSSAVEIVEHELNEAKRRLKLIEKEQADKLRLVEINTYYGERYADHTSIMKTIIIICLPIMLLTFLANRGFLPPTIYAILVIIVAVVGLIYIAKQILHTMSRDNMNYQEYNWDFKTSQAPPVDTSNPSGTNPWTTSGIMCVGQACCYDGNTYDSTLNKCIPPDVSASATTLDAANGSSGNGSGSGSGSGVYTAPMGGFGGL